MSVLWKRGDGSSLCSSLGEGGEAPFGQGAERSRGPPARACLSPGCRRQRAAALGLRTKARLAQKGACLQPALVRGTRNSQKQQCGAHLSLPGPGWPAALWWLQHVRAHMPLHRLVGTPVVSAQLYSLLSVSHTSLATVKMQNPYNQPDSTGGLGAPSSGVLHRCRVAVVAGICSGLTVGLQRGQGRVHLHLLLVRLHEGGRAALAGRLGTV